ncbi:MAG: tetratricopeptide repeat protein [Acidobacteriota bacterium]
MTRDHFLFLLIGAMGGFITGYVMHESMAQRQPEPRFSRGAVVAGAQVPTRAQAQPQAVPNAPNAGANAAMQQVQQLRAYVEANPQDLEATRRLANMNYDIANWQRAADLYERILAQKADDINVMTDLGACYRNLGQPDKALELFGRVAGLDANHWQSRYNQVLVLAFDLRDLGRARSALDELRALQPTNPDVLRLVQEVEKLGNA